ncbi:hypothetical protein ACJMK2_023521 [Sinanodonta woodiana]|uniref:PAN2-PAN3 deadenylation complex catalytic subunit PAN2 n=1 Tax=Sinanodonta woodiana TaxID=1069815 RepID=A0ABD3T4I9_SINWO
MNMDFNHLSTTNVGFPPGPLDMNPAVGMLPPVMMSEHFPQQFPPGMFPTNPDPMQGEYREVHRVLVDGGSHYGVASLCFDTQELLWMGNQGGHVTSYYGHELQKYTSFQIHASDEIRQIMSLGDRGVLFLTRGNLRCSNRRGLSVFRYTNSVMHDMQCMIQMNNTTLLVGGHQTELLELDLVKLQPKTWYKVAEPGCAILRDAGKYLAIGDTSGKVTIFDRNTMNREYILDAHSGTLSDFDVHGNLIITCGYSVRNGQMSPDRYLMAYDMRMMRPMIPIHVTLDPTFLRFVPTYSSRLAVVSQIGQFQVIEASANLPMYLYHVNTNGGLILSYDVSNNYHAMAFGDSNGCMHLYSTKNQIHFNDHVINPEFADPVEPVPPIHITDQLTPFSLIPITYPRTGRLLSDWPDHLCKKVYRKPKNIDPEILRSMKIYQDVGYAPNPGNERRNQIPYILEDKNAKKKGKTNVLESPLGRGDDPFMQIPKRYQKVILKYSKLGLEDFDFRHYNKTPFAGLETHIPNAYCNCMLQVFFFIEPLRCALLNHLCGREFCLSCELAFLFHMLDKQKGHSCQASNFLRAFRTLPEASALSLILGESEEILQRVNLGHLIQSWQRFIHQQIHSETFTKVMVPVEDEKPPEAAAPEITSSGEVPVADEKNLETSSPSTKSKKKKKKNKKKEKDEKKEQQEESPIDVELPTSPVQEEKTVNETEKSIITDLFGLDQVSTLTCKCGQETSRDTKLTLINLRYPDCSPQGPNKGPVPFSFSQVLEHSLSIEQNTQAWCSVCESYQQHNQTKKINSLPDVLALNCQLENERNMEFWKIQLMLLKQREETEGLASSSASPVPQFSSPVMCRYGKNCTRKGCRFRHETDIASEGSEDMLRIKQEDQIGPIWVPMGLKVTLSSDGKPQIDQISDQEPLPKIHPLRTKYYEIFATVVHVKEAKTGGHLVSHIKVGETFHQRKENVTCTQWYLMNDFSITPIEKYEAVQLNLDWKVPCTIYYMRRDIVQYYNLAVQNPITSAVFFDDSSILNPKRRKVTFTPLNPDELPKEGTIVGLDAEFVSLNQEESELRSDGTRSTIKPSHLSVARITCIRGDGEQTGVPFLDDYIATHEQVVDYLTQYSGIQHGDLNPVISSKHLTTLKSTYIKLRYLIDVGVIFVGHGLKKDFRVINIRVPKNQIIDTVELFYIPRQRMISLKFLAWYFLKLNIQLATHDSVEDARTALHLYFKYQEISKEGMDKVRTTINEMYEFGRKNQWKISEIEEDNVEDTIAVL